MAAEFQNWNISNFGRVKHKVRKLKADMVRLREGYQNSETKAREEKLISEIDEWLHREEMLLKQRARADWLGEGDRNTNYSHANSSARNKKNAILEFEDEAGLVFAEEEEEIDNLIVSHFRGLFKEEGVIPEVISHFIKCRKHQKTGFASLKLDMSKAYDRAECIS